MKKIYNPIENIFDYVGLSDSDEQRITNLENEIKVYEYYQAVENGTTGKVSKPEHSSIQFGRYEGYNAIVTKTDESGRPIDEAVADNSGNVVTTTLDVDGNYEFSSIPAQYPVAIVYCFTLEAQYNDEIDINHLVTQFDIDYPAPQIENIDCTSGNQTYQLPQCSTVHGKIFIIKKIDATSNTINVLPHTGETIDGESAIIIAHRYTSLSISTNGVFWSIN